jgi:hypothetical protein
VSNVAETASRFFLSLSFVFVFVRYKFINHQIARVSSGVIRDDRMVYRFMGFWRIRALLADEKKPPRKDRKASH